MKTVVITDFTADCPVCEHEHVGIWEAGTAAGDVGKEFLWCDAPVCGNGCCNCPCYYEREIGAATAVASE